ncbi:Retrovirus-related Pol polyprotein from transposon TNT 1-94 [Vitis vinifera]|uniref:Retrovirus-related Pol polyprotein from transposon TNT 1-94 n=1 Tax=Vitis vinifera TaxID=29760 RepID=A0A438JHW9_VITVI|nr:Retrovirus-related Pol polyprotein from transposon TNT 1-94 [Vitis vinifera]
MGNSGASKIVGIGDIFLETSIGNKLVLKDVRYVPNIHLNLISIGRLDDEGFTNFFGESKWKLTKGSLIVASGNKLNTLYVMEAKLHKGEINAIQKYASINLWHRRLGHISEKRLQTLARKQFLPNLQSDVPERVWTRKDVSYDHLRVFGCRTFVHVPKDERSKLDVKEKSFIFLRRVMVFLEDQLLNDIDKVKKSKSSVNIPFTVDPIPPPIVQDDHGRVEQEAHSENVNDEVPTVEQEEHGENVSNEASTINDVELTEQVEQASSSPPIEISLRRFIRERQPITRYPPNEYVMFIDRE